MSTTQTCIDDCDYHRARTDSAVDFTGHWQRGTAPVGDGGHRRVGHINHFDTVGDSRAL